MFCIYCGATLPEGAKKCTICGSPVVLPPDLRAEQPAEEAVLPEGSGEDTQLPETEPVTEAPGENDLSGSASDEQADEDRAAEAVEAQEQEPETAPEEPEMEDISSGEEIAPAEQAGPPAGAHPAYSDGYAYEEQVPQRQEVFEDYGDGYVYEEEMPPRRKRSLKWLLIVLPIVLAIAGTVTAILLWYNAPMQQLTRALDVYDYSSVAQLLPKLSEEELTSVSEQMRDYAETVIDRYNRGEAEYASSYELLDRLQRLFPNAEVSGAAEQLAALKASKESFASAQKLEQENEIAGAISRYGEVIREDTNYEAAQKQIESIKAAYKQQVLAQAQKRADEKDYLGAQAVLLNSSGILGDDPDIAAKVEELQKAELDDYVEGLLKTAKTLADDGDYPGAVRLLEDAAKEDERIDKQIQTYKDAYKEKMLAEAAKHAETSDFEEAVAVLEKSKELLGEDSDVAAKIAEYKALYPVRLVDLSPTGGADCATNWTATDISGNTYSDGLSFALYPVLATSAATEYSPYGQYKLLSGTWVVESDSTDDFIGTVRVYVDGVLQYEVNSLTRNSQPTELNLKIEGAQTVRIEAEGAFGSPRAAGYIYLAGATFRN